jgi:carbon-monoxide dehydrogenase medium subunit
VKPPPFASDRVRSVDEALAQFAEYGDDAKVLAGGQSLVPMTPVSVSIEINGRDSSS